MNLKKMISVDLKSFSANILHTRRRVNTNEFILSNARVGGPSKETLFASKLQNLDDNRFRNKNVKLL